MPTEETMTRNDNRPAVGDPAPDAEVLSPEGVPFMLSSAWEDSKVGLVFLRHYG